MYTQELMRAWGLHPMQEAFYLNVLEEKPDVVPARVTFASHDHFRILLLSSGVERLAKVTGRYFHEQQSLPVVGDWVVVSMTEGDTSSLQICELLPRISCLERRTENGDNQALVSNVDWIAIVTSFNDDLNPRRLDRAVAMVLDSRATPIIVINKSDLVDQTTQANYLEELEARYPGISVCSCSAHTGFGVKEIQSLIGVGQTFSFFGMSGVGKSSLINAILQEQIFDTQEIREDDSRGRHTTTHRELRMSPAGFWVIDTPGIRSFSFSGDENSLAESFPDIADMMKSCRFGNCSHTQEPGCGVLAALESGVLSQDKWRNYLKMKREIEYYENRGNKAYQSSKKREWAKRSRLVKDYMKLRGR